MNVVTARASPMDGSARAEIDFVLWTPQHNVEIYPHSANRRPSLPRSEKALRLLQPRQAVERPAVRVTDPAHRRRTG